MKTSKQLELQISKMSGFPAMPGIVSDIIKLYSKELDAANRFIYAQQVTIKEASIVIRTMRTLVNGHVSKPVLKRMDKWIEQNAPSIVEFQPEIRKEGKQ